MVSCQLFSDGFKRVRNAFLSPSHDQDENDLFLLQIQIARRWLDALGRLRLATSFGAQRAAAWMTGWREKKKGSLRNVLCDQVYVDGIWMADFNHVWLLMVHHVTVSLLSNTLKRRPPVFRICMLGWIHAYLLLLFLILSTKSICCYWFIGFYVRSFDESDV